METILSSHSLSPILNPKASTSKNLLSPSLQPRSASLFLSKPFTCSLKKHTSESLKPSLAEPKKLVCSYTARTSSSSYLFGTQFFSSFVHWQCIGIRD
ncbi:hypothetical protein CRYUN_Cryun09bG0186200 [Craigia yunnanensis]